RPAGTGVHLLRLGDRQLGGRVQVAARHPSPLKRVPVLRHGPVLSRSAWWLPYGYPPTPKTKTEIDESGESGQPGRRLADDQLVDLRRSLVRQHALQVVRVPQYRVLGRDAVRAEDGPALPGDREGFPYVVELAHADLLRPQLVALRPAPQVQREQVPL